jgi:hypothetical protein
MAGASRFIANADGIDKEVFDGGGYLLNCIEGHAGFLEERFKFGNALVGIVDNNVDTIAGKDEA